MLLVIGMISIADLKRTIDGNEKLNDIAKLNFKMLVDIWESYTKENQEYRSIDLSCLNDNLKDIEVKKATELLSDFPVNYKNKENVLELKKSQLEKETPLNQLNKLLAEFIKMIASNRKIAGMVRNSRGQENKENRFRGLDCGFRMILADNLTMNAVRNNIVAIDKEDSLDDDFESLKIHTNLVASLVGISTIEQAFFNNDSNLLIQKGINLDMGFIEIMDQLDHWYDINGQYQLNLQSKVIEIAQKNDIDLEPFIRNGFIEKSTSYPVKSGITRSSLS